MNIPNGFKLVPVDPTEEMLDVIRAGGYSWHLYSNLLAAAPTPTQPIYDEAKERELFESFVVGFHHGAKLTGYVHDDPDYPGLNGQFLYEDWDVQSAWAVWQKCAQSRVKAGEVGHE